MLGSEQLIESLTPSNLHQNYEPIETLTLAQLHQINEGLFSHIQENSFSEHIWHEGFKKEFQDRFCLEIRLRQIDAELMNERAEKEKLEQDLGEMLSHNHDLTTDSVKLPASLYDHFAILDPKSQIC